MMRIFWLLLLFHLLVIKVFAQRDVPFGLLGLEVYELNTRVIIRCTIDAGSSCDGITFYRTTNLPHFEQIGAIPGICGAVSEAVSYTFIDEKPVFNARNFYRVEFGNVHQSEPVFVDVYHFGEAGFQVRHNISNGQATIHFENKMRKSAALTIFDIHGNIVEQLNTNEDKFLIDYNKYVKGVYLFRIYQEKVINGKLFVP
jgi:hypothetical protein